MTIVADPPTTPTAALTRPARPSGRAFVRSYPGTGRARVHAAVVAAGERDGTHARLVLPVERLATVDGRHLPTAAPFTVNVAASELTRPLGRIAETAIAAVADHLNLTGAFTGSLRVPGRYDGGADIAAAVEHAAVDAICEATENAPTTALRRAAAAATGRTVFATGGEPGVAVHDTATAGVVQAFESFPRFYVVYAHVVAGAGGVDTTGVAEAGDLSKVPAGRAGSEKDVARWLTEASAARQSPSALRPLLEAVHADGSFGTLGVVGGHREMDPVALLLPADHTSLLRGQQVMVRLTRELAALAAQAAAAKTDLPLWRVTMSRMASA